MNRARAAIVKGLMSFGPSMLPFADAGTAELPLGRRDLSARIAERREYHIADHADDMPRGVDHMILEVERLGEQRIRVAREPVRTRSIGV